MPIKPKSSEIKSLGEYERTLSQYENINDFCILPELKLIVRIDARRMDGYWDDVPDEDYPYGDKVFRAFLDTARNLMSSGFRVTYAFQHGDEVSLLLDDTENASPRRRAKLVSLVASAGSIYFDKAFGHPVLFHAKLSELPTAQHAVDYFMWQRKVATRNVLSRTLGLALARDGLSAQEIHSRIDGLTEEQRIAMSRELGCDYDLLPAWQRFGAAVWWEEQPGGGLKMVQSLELPDTDLEYLRFVERRVEGPSFAVDSGRAEVLEGAATVAPPPLRERNAPAPVSAIRNGPFRLGAKRTVTVFDKKGAR